jgi:hypothetical protein
MQRFFAAEHRLHCEQRQDRQRSGPKLRVSQCGPRQRSQHQVGEQRNGQAIHKIKWCTGKDSNLRTSLGGTDLQSVGFNHSPTCANFLGRCSRYAPSSRPPDRLPENVHGKPAEHNYALLSQHRETKARAQDTAKITTRRKSSEWSAFRKTCCAATAAC